MGILIADNKSKRMNFRGMAALAFAMMYENMSPMSKLAGKVKRRMKQAVSIKSKISLGNLISVCPGKRHGWYESNVGPVRKPLNAMN
ncbi:MAG: hypothetical protein WCS96_07905 [Victivallales bacterium]